MAADDPTKVVGRRTVAFLLDWLLISLIGTGLFFLLAHKVDGYAASSVNAHLTVGSDRWEITGGAAFAYFVLNVVVLVLLAGVLEGRTGWTPGKLALGVRVVRPDGSAPGIGRALARLAGWLVDGFPYFPFGLVAFITALVNAQHRRVGDMMADTYVVRAAQMGSPLDLPVPGPPVSTVATPAPGLDAFGNPVSVPPARPPSPAPAAAADWYPDPTGEKRLRYWDGTAWTSHVAD